MTISRAGTGALVLALAGLGAGGVRAQAPGAPPQSMTLDEVVAAAVAHSPQMVQGQGGVREAAAAQRAAKGSFLPSVTLSTGASLLGNTRAGGATVAGAPAGAAAISSTASSYNAGVSASMDVFDGGKRVAELARTRANATAADANLQQQQYSVTLAAKNDFFDVLRSDELVKAAQAEAQRAGEALSAAQDRLKAGAATRSDVLRAQLAVTQAQQALSQAQSQGTTARYTLGRAVGYDGPVLPAAGVSLEPRPLALTTAQLDSLVTTRAPAVQAAAAAVRASSASISSAKSAYLPQLSVGAGYDWTHGQSGSLSPTTGALSGNTSWDLRAAVTLPVFDGFQRDQAVTQARVAADEARATLDDQRRGQRVALQQDLAALENTRNQITLGEQAVQSAQEDLRVQQERYRMGASTMLDVITSQSALTQAEQSLVNARYDYQVARATIESLAGRAL